jgi:hypothetical protein
MPPGGTVVDILRDLRRDLARQVRMDAGDERCGDDAPRLEDVGRTRAADPCPSSEHLAQIAA